MAVLLTSGVAHAFDDSGAFFAPSGVVAPATLGASAEGIYFTGAPRYSGLDCSSCHTSGPQLVTVQLGADTTALFTSGYVPGQTYELEVSLGNETEGTQYDTPTCTEAPAKAGQFPYVQCNHNSFALEIDSANLPLSGPNVFCAAPPTADGCPMPIADTDEVVVTPGGDAVFANRPHSTTTPYELLHNDVTRWHLWWTAPPAGTGPLVFYVAAVDGNGGSGTITSDQDPYGDDTVTAQVPIAEAGSILGFDASAGCSFAPHAAGGPGVMLGLLLSILTATRRRRC